jgi:CRP-like cAMP-binding protein
MATTSATLDFTLPNDLKNALQLLASTRREQRQTVLFRRGDPPSGVYVILRGSVVLDVHDRVYRTAQQDSIIGLPAIFSGQPYSLTAIAAEDCELGFIARETIFEFVRSNPSLAIHLLEILAAEVEMLREMSNGNGTVH